MSGPEPCTLSVIIPTYNYGEFLVPAIQSVLTQAQDLDGIEVVVADDGSTDNTRGFVDAMDAGERVRYFRQENRGPAGARNLALSHARGRYLMFLDADDSLREDCLSTTIAFLDAHPEVGLFFTNYDIYDAEGIVAESGVDLWKSFRSIPHREVGDGWVFTESLTPHIVRAGAFMHTSGLTLRRETYERIGPFHEGFAYGEDDEFYARAAWATTAGYVDRVLSRKRNHPRSLIHDPANTLRNAEHLLQISEIQLDYYRDDPELVAILRRKICECVFSLCWRLIEDRRNSEARSILRKYRARFPRYGGFYRLFLRSFVPV